MLQEWSDSVRRAQPWRTNRARALRANATSAEDLIWSELRNRQLGGLKFVRQAPIGAFYVDFLCRAHKIVVEIDGATHGTIDELQRDRARAAYLMRSGFCIFRAHNDDVFNNLDGVLDHLLAMIEKRSI